jgi:oligoribonuclease NrnB/cAMP/cGMP phosphodiesterase (DHH superfamily)
MKTLALYHSADLDGIACREVLKRYLTREGVDAEDSFELVGYNYGDPLDPILSVLDKFDRIIMADICIDALITKLVDNEQLRKLTWLDHHISSITKWSHIAAHINGLRIDGVAACRLAWNYFFADQSVLGNKATKNNFVNRRVREPYLIRLLGEHDIWDHRDPNSIPLQFGLDADVFDFSEYFGFYTEFEKAGELLEDSAATTEPPTLSDELYRAIMAGHRVKTYVDKQSARIMLRTAFIVEFEGLTFLAANNPSGNSLAFESMDIPQNPHNALLMYYFSGVGQVTVSLYHANGCEFHDLSLIAIKYGGGGHKGACGFTLPLESFIQRIANQRRLGEILITK